mmetsp:Transcript_25131/g.35993  ORF Transcript_25131/g.35993 Transcript_25131/m.35993 type:complete len:107 (-) Transcript_25131:2678-2998(-)
MHTRNVPERLWDYGFKHAAKLRSMVAHDSLNGRTPYELLTGKTPDISELVDFTFYDWVKYYDPVAFLRNGSASATGSALLNILDKPFAIMSSKTMRKSLHALLCAR